MSEKVETSKKIAGQITIVATGTVKNPPAKVEEQEDKKNANDTDDDAGTRGDDAGRAT